MDYDVIVVGAGPAGSTVAYEVARHGYDVLLAEEHPQVGIPSHCTGKLSSTAIRELSLEIREVLAELRGAIFHSPSGIELAIERKEAQAYVLDRTSFDSRLASKATQAGAALVTAARASVKGVNASKVRVSLESRGGSVEKTCRVVVGADGVASSVARQTGLYSKAPTDMRLGAQKEFIKVNSPVSGFAETFFGTRFAPGFFAWLVPCDKAKARVGLCVSPGSGETAMNRLNHLTVSHPVVSQRLRESEAVGESTHAIPTGGTLRRTVADGVLVVGDAAGQVKSTTGGGLYYGILCARIAAESLTEALGKGEGTVPCREIEDYERRWRRDLGEEISFGCRVRSFLDSLTDEEVDFLFQTVKDDDSLVGLIEGLGDIDYQSRVGRSLLPRITVALSRRPRLLSKAAKHLLIPQIRYEAHPSPHSDLRGDA